MIRKANTLYQNIAISILLLGAYFTQIAYLTTDEGYYTVFIVIGFTSGFYLWFGKKILPSIILTSVFGVIILEMIINSKLFIEAFLHTIPLVAINILIPIIFKKLLDVFKVKVPTTLSDAVRFIIIIAIVSILAALMSCIHYGIAYGNFLIQLHEFIQSMFIGLAIFGTTIYFSNYYDSFLSKRKHLKYPDVLFALLFASFTYTVFSNTIPGFTFSNYGFFFIILFIVNAYAFNYRMLVFISWLYVLIYNMLYTRIIDTNPILTHGSLNTYLLILLGITIFTKILLSETKEKNRDLALSEKRYATMLNSTFELLKVRDTLSYNDESFIENNMSQIFDIAMRIFHKFEHGICALKGTQYVKIIDIQGHPEEVFKNFKMENHHFRWSNYTPMHTQQPNEIYQRSTGDNYLIYKDYFESIKESLSILIKISDNEMGAITFEIMKNSEDTFTRNDINNIAAFQRMINSFYEMNQLAIKNNSLRDDIVLSLIRALELYDQYTGRHNEDVAYIAELLAKNMNIKQEKINDISWAGLVHDIGKIGIPYDIINKKSKLTLAEYEEVKKHSIYGYEILNKSTDLKYIASLVKHHHEWYNGSGYPDGLAKDDIPFGAQILQVADSISAMATKRSYHDKKSWESIIKELEMYQGVQFNPELTEIAIKIIKDKTLVNYFNNKKQ